MGGWWGEIDCREIVLRIKVVAGNGNFLYLPREKERRCRDLRGGFSVRKRWEGPSWFIIQKKQRVAGHHLATSSGNGAMPSANQRKEAVGEHVHEKHLKLPGANAEKGGWGGAPCSREKESIVRGRRFIVRYGALKQTE